MSEKIPPSAAQDLGQVVDDGVAIPTAGVEYGSLSGMKDPSQGEHEVTESQGTKGPVIVNTPLSNPDLRTEEHGDITIRPDLPSTSGTSATEHYTQAPKLSSAQLPPQSPPPTSPFSIFPASPTTSWQPSASDSNDPPCPRCAAQGRGRACRGGLPCGSCVSRGYTAKKCQSSGGVVTGGGRGEMSGGGGGGLGNYRGSGGSGRRGGDDSRGGGDEHEIWVVGMLFWALALGGEARVVRG